MKTFTPGSAETRKVMFELIREHHVELGRTNLQIIMVESDAPIPPIQVAIFSARARAAGSADAAIMIDQFEFEDWTPTQRRAAIDHSLASFRPVVRGGVCVVDSAKRPRLKRRPAELIVGGYLDVLKRWGVDSIEHAQTDALTAILPHSKPLSNRVGRRVKVKPASDSIFPNP